MTKVNVQAAPSLSLDALFKHLNHHYHQPDTEALEVVLAVVASHYITDRDPIWLFLQGPPGTGKTEMGIVPLYGLKHAHALGDLTPRTFLSGKAGTAGQASLLTKKGSSILFLVKDFTTLMSKKPEDRTAIVSQMREIYDGRFTKDTGDGSSLPWQGKATMIAAVTHAIEREWALLRDLGERFMTVRWERGNGIELARQAITRTGTRHGAVLASTKLIQEIIVPERIPSSVGCLPHAMTNPIAHMAELGAIARGRVVRDSMGKREIIDVPPPEAGTRFANCMNTLIAARAILRKRDPIREDLKFARRMLFDSIPLSRIHVLQAIPQDGTPIEHGDVVKLTGMPGATVKWIADELAALRLLSLSNEGGIDVFRASKMACDLWSVIAEVST